VFAGTIRLVAAWKCRAENRGLQVKYGRLRSEADQILTVKYRFLNAGSYPILVRNMTDKPKRPNC
jgi:hypothetical protein